jgi:hypothetical protein
MPISERRKRRKIVTLEVDVDEAKEDPEVVVERKKSRESGLLCKCGTCLTLLGF